MKDCSNCIREDCEDRKKHNRPHYCNNYTSPFKGEDKMSITLDEWIEKNKLHDLEEDIKTHIEIYGSTGSMRMHSNDEVKDLVRLIMISIRDKAEKIQEKPPEAGTVYKS